VLGAWSNFDQNDHQGAPRNAFAQFNTWIMWKGTLSKLYKQVGFPNPDTYTISVRSELETQ
jgi:hypothetical protein